MGYGDERARKICGRIQADIEGGSSQEEQYGSAASMSFPPQQKQEPKEKPEEKAEGITLSQQEAEVVISALVNAKEAVGSQAPELSQQLDQAIAAFKEKANVSE
jgi:hypothetical protein